MDKKIARSENLNSESGVGPWKIESPAIELLASYLIVVDLRNDTSRHISDKSDTVLITVAYNDHCFFGEV